MTTNRSCEFDFKEGKPCSDGRAMLKEQLEFMNVTEKNPFVPDENDIMQAAPEELLVDEDEVGDQDDCDVDIL